MLLLVKDRIQLLPHREIWTFKPLLVFSKFTLAIRDHVNLYPVLMTQTM